MWEMFVVLGPIVVLAVIVGYIRAQVKPEKPKKVETGEIKLPEYLPEKERWDD